MVRDMEQDIQLDFKQDLKYYKDTPPFLRISLLEHPGQVSKHIMKHSNIPTLKHRLISSLRFRPSRDSFPTAEYPTEMPLSGLTLLNI